MNTTSQSLAFGEEVRTARQAKKISQQALAEAAGCSQRLISELERGKASVELGKALAVAEALDLRFSLQPIRKPSSGRQLADYL